MALSRDGSVRLWMTVLGCSAVLTVAGEPLHAQGPNARQGFWIGAGVGTGLGRARCDICSNDREDALSGYVKVGGTPGRRVLIGVEGTGWTRRGENVRTYLGTLMASAYWYPGLERSPWYVKGGLGVLAYRADPDEADDDVITAKSLGGVVGVGCDLRVLPRLFVSPYFNFIASFGAHLRAGRQVLTNVNVTLVQLGMGLTLH